MCVRVHAKKKFLLGVNVRRSTITQRSTITALKNTQFIEKNR